MVQFRLTKQKDSKGNEVDILEFDKKSYAIIYDSHLAQTINYLLNLTLQKNEKKTNETLPQEP